MMGNSWKLTFFIEGPHMAICTHAKVLDQRQASIAWDAVAVVVCVGAPSAGGLSSVTWGAVAIVGAQGRWTNSRRRLCKMTGQDAKWIGARDTHFHSRTWQMT